MLVGDDWGGVIADFGLVADGESATPLQAPEVYTLMEYSSKSDMGSYGVVVGELAGVA